MVNLFLRYKMFNNTNGSVDVDNKKVLGFDSYHILTYFIPTNNALNY